MSEFTECYQLLANDVAEGAALLERAGLDLDAVRRLLSPVVAGRTWNCCARRSGRTR